METMMAADQLNDVLQRLSHLLKAEERKLGKQYGLQPVQLEALHYLSRCNKYSNNGMGVTEYFGLTKGTVSQTLRALENKGFVTRRPHSRDRRKIQLEVTDAGKEVMHLFPLPLLQEGWVHLDKMDQEQMVMQLNRFLRTLQHTNRTRTFGVCHSCHHFVTPFQGVYQCGLTKERLYDAEINLICREHSVSS